MLPAAALLPVAAADMLPAAAVLPAAAADERPAAVVLPAAVALHAAAAAAAVLPAADAAGLPAAAAVVLPAAAVAVLPAAAAELPDPAHFASAAVLSLLLWPLDQTRNRANLIQYFSLQFFLYRLSHTKNICL